jgi:hypothetical protein
MTAIFAKNNQSTAERGGWTASRTVAPLEGGPVAISHIQRFPNQADPPNERVDQTLTTQWRLNVQGAPEDGLPS